LSASPGACRAGQVTRQAVPVDQGETGCYRQRAQGARHAEQRGSKDVEPIDFLGLDMADGKRQGALADFQRESIALAFRERLGVCKPGNRLCRIEDDGGHHHRTGQGPAAGLIDTSNTTGLIHP